MSGYVFLVLLLVKGAFAIYLTNTSIVKTSDNPAQWTESGVWGPILEEWALTNHRESKVMKFTSPSPNEFVTIERSDAVVESKESKITPGKIVNTIPTRNTSTNKKPPGRQVTETDLYLLNAIEKLVYRADFMEKRLRRVEEMLYYVMAGNRVDQEPCPENFTRAGANCYHFAAKAGREMDWKVASKFCHRLGAVLVETETAQENQDLIASIQNDSYLRGKDFWTGGLNPGLLWIWSSSAKPVSSKDNPAMSIVGDGRCLRMAYDPSSRNYIFKGSDCSVRYSFICELPESTSSNEIKRIGRKLDVLQDL